MSRNIVKPGALVRIRAGQGGGGSLTSWDYGLVEVRDGGRWMPHPGWPEQTKTGLEPTSFDIVLNSNTIEMICQSHLSCYHSARPFCFRPHRGDDRPDVALRMDAKGNYVHIECNPDLCPLRKLAKGAGTGGKDGVALRSDDVRAYAKSYPYAKLTVGKNMAKCTAYTFFIFDLLTPTGERAHPEGEFAMFVTHGDTTTDRVRSKLRRLSVKCHGKLKGLRLKFVYAPFTQSDSRRSTSAWDILVPDDVDFDRQQLEAANRRRVINYDAIDPDSTAMVLANTEYNVTNWIAAEQPEALKEIEGAGFDYLDENAVNANKIQSDTIALINQHPTVRALCVRLRIPYAQQVAMPMLYGEDVYKCIENLLEVSNRYTDDIIADSAFAGAFTRRPQIETPATEPEIIDAEIVEPDAQDVQARVRGKGGSKTKVKEEPTPTENPPATSRDPQDATPGDFTPPSDEDIDEAVSKLGGGK